jgi:hypothetical protein
MKKINWNIVFVVVGLALSASNAQCTVIGGGPLGSAPDAASTSVMLGIAGLGLAAVRKFLR